MRRAETLPRDGQKATRFYAGFGITEAVFRRGVSATSTEESAEESEVGKTS